jgi:hypothetical protein
MPATNTNEYRAYRREYMKLYRTNGPLVRSAQGEWTAAKERIDAYPNTDTRRAYMRKYMKERRANQRKAASQ